MNHPENLGHDEKAKSKKKEIEEGKVTQFKGTEAIVNIFIQEIFSNFKKEMHIKVQGTHRTPSRLEQKR